MSAGLCSAVPPHLSRLPRSKPWNWLWISEEGEQIDSSEELFFSGTLKPAVVSAACGPSTPPPPGWPAPPSLGSWERCPPPSRPASTTLSAPTSSTSAGILHLGPAPRNVWKHHIMQTDCFHYGYSGLTSWPSVTEIMGLFLKTAWGERPFLPPAHPLNLIFLLPNCGSCLERPPVLCEPPPCLLRALSDGTPQSQGRGRRCDPLSTLPSTARLSAAASQCETSISKPASQGLRVLPAFGVNVYNMRIFLLFRIVIKTTHPHKCSTFV